MTSQPSLPTIQISSLEKTLESLSSLSMKLERLEIILAPKTQDLVGCVQNISDRTKALSLEIEELKTMKESLKIEIKQALQEELKQIAPSFSKQASDSFHQQVRPLLDSPLEVLQKISYEADKTVSVLKSMAIKGKTRLILMGLSLVASVCLACGIMAMIFFYFFPQTIVVKYENNFDQILQIIYGKTVIDNFKSLKPEDQALLEKAMDETIRQFFSKKKAS